MFSKYYEDELAYLRDVGSEFAAAHPALAPMLAGGVTDPGVERLLEGVAFLTARVREKLDDELPEAIHAIAETLFPHLVRPVPAATILELSPSPESVADQHTLPVGSEFASVEVEGVRCVFSSTAPCILVPWAIEGARIETLSEGGAQLRVDFRVLRRGAFARSAPEALRLHFAGASRTSLGLLAWLHQHVTDVVLLEGAPEDAHARQISLGKRALQPVGFGEDEGLLPFESTAFLGFRLLQEYYVLPSKFAFVDVKDVARAGEWGAEIETFSIAFRCDAPPPTDVRVEADTVKLHCVPAVNIFPATAEPVRVDTGREQYLVRPAGYGPGEAEVYRIDRVEAFRRRGADTVVVPSFYDVSHTDGGRAGAPVFYTTHLRSNAVRATADVSIAFGTPEDRSETFDAEVVSIDLLATNGPLASAVRAGEISLTTPRSPTVAKFRNLAAATAYVPVPLGRELQWRAVAHASMNMQSLADPAVLRSMLEVYSLHSASDRQAARANELRVNAVRNVRITPAERLYRGSVVRGVAIEIDLDEKGFSGDGDMFLFGAILDNIFAAYVSINTFSEVSVKGTHSRVSFSWPARSGRLSLL